MDSNEQEYSKVINTLVKNQNFEMINHFFKRYLDNKTEIVVLKWREIITTDLIADKLMYRSATFSSFWSLTEYVFGELSEAERSLVLGWVSEVSEFNDESLNAILGIMAVDTEKMNLKQKYDFYYQKLHSILIFLPTKYKSSQFMRNVWFNINISSTKSIFVEEYSNKQIDLDECCFQILLRVLNQENENKRFFSVNEIIQSGRLEVIYELLKSRQLTYEGALNFPVGFFALRIFQKLLVKIDSTTPLEESVLTSLVDSIDFSDKYFGAELNDFVLRHSIATVIDGKYKDAVYSLGAKWITDKAMYDVIIPENAAMAEKYADILINSSFHNTSAHYSSVDAGIEYNRDGQIDETIKAYTSGKISPDQYVFINDLLRILINNVDSYLLYRKLVCEVLKFEVDKSYDTSIVDDWLKQCFKQGKTTFSYYEQRLLLSVLDGKNTELTKMVERVYIENINLISFEHDDIYSDKFPDIIDLTKFMNSSLGLFVDVIFHNERFLDCLSVSEFENKISELDNKIKSYILGRFYAAKNLFDKMLLLDVNGFVGFSNHYRINVKYAESSFAVNNVKKLLRIGYFDDFSRTNMVITMVMAISPDTVPVGEMSLNSKQLKAMLNMLEEYMLNSTVNSEKQFLTGWISWLMQTKQMELQVIDYLWIHLENKNVSNLNKLFRLVETDLQGEHLDGDVEEYNLYRLTMLDTTKKENVDFALTLLAFTFKKGLVYKNRNVLGFINGFGESLMKNRADTEANRLRGIVDPYFSEDSITF